MNITDLQVVSLISSQGRFYINLVLKALWPKSSRVLQNEGGLAVLSNALSYFL